MGRESWRRMTELRSLGSMTDQQAIGQLTVWAQSVDEQLHPLSGDLDQMDQTNRLLMQRIERLEGRLVKLESRVIRRLNCGKD